MSQTQTVDIDPYLAQQTMPPNDLTPDAKFVNIRMTTPIGRFGYIHVDAPFAIPNTDPTQPSRPMFSATLLMAPGTNERPIIADLHRAACLVVDKKFGKIQRPNPQNTNEILQVNPSELFWTDEKMGGLHYPLRQGNDNYMREPNKFQLWRNLWFINVGMSPKTKSGTDQRPICLDEKGQLCDPKLFYPGCYGRMTVTASWFEHAGKRGATFYLNAVQFARHGERMATFDPGAAAQAAFAKAGAITGDVGTPPPGGPTGFGPNTATAAPPGVPAGTPFGFAAPPQQQQMPAGQPQQGSGINYGTLGGQPEQQQPQQGALPPGTGRPPGV